MAIFDGKRLRGIVGNVVFKDDKDKKNTIVQQAPVVVRQSEKTKVASGVFGQGSVLAGVIRRDMEIITRECYDSGMCNRFNKPVRDILNKCFDKATKIYHFSADSFEPLTGFEFNLKSLVTNSLYVKPVVSLSGNQLTVSIPEIQVKQQLKFPAGANLCEIGVVVCFVALEQGMKQEESLQSIEIGSGATVLLPHNFIFEVPEGCLCVVGLGLNYFHKQNDIKTVKTHKTFNPANICGAIITEGVFVDPGMVKTGNTCKASPWSKIIKMNLGGTSEGQYNG